MSRFFYLVIYAFSRYKKALRMLFRGRLGFFFLIPLFLQVALIAVCGYYLLGISSEISQFFAKYTSEINVAYSWLEGVLTFFVKILGYIVSFLLVLFMMLISGNITLIIMAPLLAYISELTEKKMNGVEYDFNMEQFLQDVWRGIIISVRNLFYELLFFVLFFFLGFIPIIGQIGAIVMFLITAYYFGFSFMDYALERRRMNAKQRIQFMKMHRGLAVGCGVIFSAVMIIPFSYLFLGVFAVLGVVAGTITIIEFIEEEKLLQVEE